jgi:uncharacterized BrkB/YihY/UPF0761 family membrane protein
LPGALLAVVLWAALVIGFRYYLALGFGAPTGVLSDDPRVTLIGQAVASVVATSFLFYFASQAVLLGAELNAALIARRPVDPTTGSRDDETERELAEDPTG